MIQPPNEEYCQDIKEILSLLHSLTNYAEESKKNQKEILLNQKEILSLQTQILQIFQEIENEEVSEDDEVSDAIVRKKNKSESQMVH